MALKLDKQDLARRDNFVTNLRELAGKLEDAIATYNAEVLALRGPLQTVLTEYNELVSEARGWAEDIASQADNDIDDKSERWRESEKGQAASEWKDTWEAAELDDLELEFPDDLSDEINEPAADVLEALPVEPE